MYFIVFQQSRYFIAGQAFVVCGDFPPFFSKRGLPLVKVFEKCCTNRRKKKQVISCIQPEHAVLVHCFVLFFPRHNQGIINVVINHRGMSQLQSYKCVSKGKRKLRKNWCVKQAELLGITLLVYITLKARFQTFYCGITQKHFLYFQFELQQRFHFPHFL